MQIAIVGLAGAGKTTVFNTLTRGHAETGGYGGIQLNVGVVKVPDDRLDRLAEVFKPRKIVHADVTYVDLPAPPSSTEGRVGTEELPAEHLARLREADALIHVVRAWDDAAHPHPEGSVDPRATWSASTSSSSSPTSPSSTDASSGWRPAADGMARPPSARPRSGSRRCSSD